MDKIEKLRQAIAQLPRVSLGVLPTPFENLARLSKHLSGPEIYMKRDDLTGLAFGGNKTRMLEFSLADALTKGADTVVTGAAVQSNYCRQMAAACAKLGLELHLVLRPEREIDQKEIQGNHLLQRLFGAQVTILENNNRDKQQSAIQAKIGQLRSKGKTVYHPRQAETIDLDVIAYAEAAIEIVQQCREYQIVPDYLYTAAADTTQAGLVLGLKYLESSIRVRGFNPLPGSLENTQSMVDMAAQAAARLGFPATLTIDDFDSDDRFLGERYGVPTEAGVETIYLAAQTEGILLDPVYTSKAMSGLIAHIQMGLLPVETPVIFLHTGGAPALFGYVQDIMGASG
ncbi:D-cysteine desulfhydrase family protein [Chloroflexi bacterium TSY]|nr:D-cysteine desulfhydrase family protein [Chloroflexi bacterium TSY]